MTEKEKMIAGLPYSASNDESLTRDWEHAKSEMLRYNNLPPWEKSERDRLIKSFLGRTGKKITIVSPFLCDYGYNIEIGENFFSNMNLVILDCAKVTIGDNVMIAPNVGIYTATHPLVAEERNTGLEYALPVIIGNGVWIGAQSAILPGVTIGDNSVIGAGSVVTKDIPSGVLAVGNPCRVVREITDADKML